MTPAECRSGTRERGAIPERTSRSRAAEPCRLSPPEEPSCGPPRHSPAFRVPTMTTRERAAIGAALSIAVAVAGNAYWRLSSRIATLESQVTRATRPDPGNRSRLESVTNGPLLSLAGAQTKGNVNARVVVVEYSDFQCSYCATFARQTLPELDSRYISTGKVVAAFRHYPVESLHPHAFKAAVAAECAGRQDRFWQLHDRLFDRRGDLGFDKVVEDARTANVSMTDFQRCVTGDGQQQVRRDLMSGR